jgi:hypothetical protein
MSADGYQYGATLRKINISLDSQDLLMDVEMN